MKKNTGMKSTWIHLSLALVCGVGLSACAADAGTDDADQAADTGEEGPSASSTEALSTSVFQLPFPCGQVWSGQTRSDHSPPDAVDFNRADDLGDTVVAAAAGKVSRVDNEGNVSYGRWVEVNHGDGYTTRYAHLSVQSVSVGESVSAGQKIGEVGSTGGSTGPHLHYELRHNGANIKPMFDGVQALFFGTKNYTSKNKCGSSSSSVSGTVNTAGAPLTVRSAASTSSTAVGSVSDGQHVTISCQKSGTSVTGTYGTSSLWDYIGTGYVADAYVLTGSDGQVAPTCK